MAAAAVRAAWPDSCKGSRLPPGKRPPNDGTAAAAAKSSAGSRDTVPISRKSATRGGGGSLPAGINHSEIRRRPSSTTPSSSASTDAWFWTTPPGSSPWGMWIMGAAWNTQHFMEHYRFTLDREFLEKRAYPILQEASAFFLDWLVEDPETGVLVSGVDTAIISTVISDTLPDQSSQMMGRGLDIGCHPSMGDCGTLASPVIVSSRISVPGPLAPAVSRTVGASPTP